MTGLAFPSWLYGVYSEVHRRVARRATALANGASFDELAGDELTAVVEVPGLIILDRRWSQTSPSGPHFHADLLWTVFEARLLKVDESGSLFLRAAAEGIGAAWSLTGLLASQRYQVVRRASQQLDFLEASSRQWEMLLTAGSRFTVGGNRGSPLPELP